MPAIGKAFDLMGDDLVEIPTKKKSLKTKYVFTMKNGEKRK